MWSCCLVASRDAAVSASGSTWKLTGGPFVDLVWGGRVDPSPTRRRRRQTRKPASDGRFVLLRPRPHPEPAGDHREQGDHPEGPQERRSPRPLDRRTPLAALLVDGDLVALPDVAEAAQLVEGGGLLTAGQLEDDRGVLRRLLAGPAGAELLEPDDLRLLGVDAGRRLPAVPEVEEPPPDHDDHQQQQGQRHPGHAVVARPATREAAVGAGGARSVGDGAVGNGSVVGHAGSVPNRPRSPLVEEDAQRLSRDPPTLRPADRG